MDWYAHFNGIKSKHHEQDDEDFWFAFLNIFRIISENEDEWWKLAISKKHTLPG